MNDLPSKKLVISNYVLLETSWNLMLNNTYYVCFYIYNIWCILEKMFYEILYELLLIGWNIIIERIKWTPIIWITWLCEYAYLQPSSYKWSLIIIISIVHIKIWIMFAIHLISLIISFYYSDNILFWVT